MSEPRFSTVIEPFRVHSVEPIVMTTAEQRRAAVRDAGFNLFQLRARDVLIDLLEAMVRLGSTLGLVTIVEGVETEEQLERLLEIGVRVAQGWLFGKAMPADEIEARYGPQVSASA